METMKVESDGRLFEIKKLGPGGQMRVMRIAGAELAKNQNWVVLAQICASIVSIDGVPVPDASRPEHYEATMDRCGDAALTALVPVYKQLNGIVENADEGAEASALAKN